MPLRRHVAGHLTREQRLRRLVEDVLVGAGYCEAYTWSLVADDPDPAAVRLPDPMSGDQAILRTTLLAGLVESARTNLDAGNERIALFELARVYLPSGGQLPDERWRVAGIASGGFSAARAAVEAVHEALHLDLEVRRSEHPSLHPGKSAATGAGWFGELHPALLEGEWGVFELDLETLTGPVPERILYEDVVTFPANRQDLAIVVDDGVEAGELVSTVRDAGGSWLRDARVFDVYRGEQVGVGRKSVAIHLAFQASDRTLTDDDVAGARGDIVSALSARHGAELRG
jgi:phenylalanyl-tRNA synthetase beta chain